MHIYDIKPTETFWDEVDDRNLYKEDAKLWSKKELIDDIRKNGLKYQLNVDSEGNIKNGNMRYWCMRYLFEVENDKRFEYPPVQRNWAAGCFWKEISFTTKHNYNMEQMHTICDDMGQQITEHWINQTRDLVIPHAETFPNIVTDPINNRRTENYWAVQRSMWARYYFPQPKKEDTMTFMATIGPSMPTPIMNESEAIINLYKQWTVDNRGDRVVLDAGFPLELYKTKKKKKKLRKSSPRNQQTQHTMTLSKKAGTSGRSTNRRLAGL